MKRLNGKFDAEQRETLRTGIEARNNVHGIDPVTCVDQMAGSFVGRLCLAGRITTQQHEAARTYLTDWQNMSIASGGPKVPGAVNPNSGSRGQAGAENEIFSIDAMAKWATLVWVVRHAQQAAGNRAVLISALDHCVIRDEPHEHMVGWLRIGLDALALHYRIGDKPKKTRERAIPLHPALTE